MKIFDLEVHKKDYYKGYDPTVNPTIANSFSTAAYRFGHSLVQRSFIRFDSDHRPIFNNVSIHDEFTNPVNLDTAGSVDRLLLGLVNQPCQRRDEFITEEMTNHLFQTPGFPFGMDLASLNIQRGRDHGIPPYIRWRKPCSLSPIRTFEDLSKVMSLDIIRKLKSLYSSVDDIDLFSAGLAEKSVIGGLVGPTFACIIAQQFSNLRRGDRFWYENPNSESSFTAGQLQQIRQVTLAQVLCQTMDDIKTIQPFVFLATDVLKNQRLSCDDLAIGHLSLELWTEQPSEFKSNVDNSQKVKRAATDTSFSISKLKEENIHPRRKIHPESNPEHTKVTTLKPFQNSINQENKIIVKRPLVHPNNNNVTIVVQNNAVNALVFVNEGIYGSHIKIQEQLPINSTFRPQEKPIPTTISHSSNFYLARQPYVPYTFNDPHNPNPLVYGYRLPPFTQDDISYDNYPATSPRPTLYTYYTNFQQTITQMPEIDGYLINYGLSYHNLIPAYSYEKPKLLENFGHNKLKEEQNPAKKKPNYADLKLLTNMELIRLNYVSSDKSYTHKPNYDEYKYPTTTRPNFRPNYATNDEFYRTHGPSYNKHKPSITRPNSRTNYEINNESHHTHRQNYCGYKPSTITQPNYVLNSEPYHTDKPSNDEHRSLTSTQPNLQSNFGWNDKLYHGSDYNVVKLPCNSRPNEDLHHVQNLIYNGFTSLTNFRSDKSNQESYGKQKLNGVRNLYLQNSDLINRLNEGHFINLNKPQYQEQWNLNDQKRLSKTPYDYDDLNLYQIKPNVKPPSYSVDMSHQILFTTKPSNEYNFQFWKKDSLQSIKNFVQSGLYGSVPSSETNIPSYQKDTFTDSNISFPINNNYNRYSGTTQIYQKILSSTQSGWLDVLSHIKQGNTQSLFSKNKYPYSSFLFNQTSTSYSTYQKDDQSKASLKVSGNKSFVDVDSHEHNSHKNPLKSSSLNEQLLSSTSYWLEISTTGIQVHKQEENSNPKRTKVQSVTIVNKTIEAVHHPGHTGYVSQLKATSKISTPLVQQIKSNVSVTKKAGQYYYDKNVLYQYPDKIVNQSPKNNPYLTDKFDGTLIRNGKITSEKIAIETSVDKPITSSEMVQNENKLTTTPTLLITAHGNHTGDVEDIQSDFSIDIGSVAPADVPDRKNH
ncbi:PREDICTED: uncharacterized protein LOC108758877 [Trachymyrmex cornetzi]|uniref:uncharacterized protein LOC108758877 n=1 Tax=Trachymyrmex cornetzi TaxID=471704 RepID=UPI00084F6F63|nr:PREDICTED: uncharacterized protein LOC108758877 [Trachymyrmex cornetzi]